jgi:hypothetical protein
MKALDSWARQFGYSDFDTYIRAGGGSLEDVRTDIHRRIRLLHDALKALSFDEPEPEDPMRLTPASAGAYTPVGSLDLTTGKLEEAPAKTEDEPPDPENAQIQGAEHGEP